ncbi:MAG: Ig-like domain-containing protein [Anaerolineales bacterium]|nr:Ig-like domain-containing protein [Anaerolineales bacterium]
MAVSFYDSDLPPASSHPNDTGWNATPSDMYNSANPLVDYAFSDNELYTRSRYIQWFPDDKGGGRTHPVPTNIIVESRIAFFGTPETIRVSYRVVNEGDDSHAIANQEFPFAYVRTPYNRYVSYTGSDPWTNGQPTIVTMPSSGTGGATAIATERWAGFMNPEDEGLVLWAPQSYGQFTYGHFDNPGPVENSTFYLLPRALFSIPAGFSQETYVFIFMGNWVRSRAQIHQLAVSLDFDDIMPPFGTIDAPSQGGTVSGVATLDGWAIDDLGVATIRFTVDGESHGAATYGGQREDVARDYPGLPGSPYFGFWLHLDTRTLPNGTHTLELVAEDTSGNTSQLRPGILSINVQN